jgi:pantothenate kinase
VDIVLMTVHTLFTLLWICSQAVGDLTAVAAAAVGAASAPALTSSSSSSSNARIPLSVAVSGSKGSGKSAFARLLVNRLLSQGHGVVAFLDLDPGQPEFTPPVSQGLLSQVLFIFALCLCGQAWCS